jgi:hypothetical protein
MHHHHTRQVVNLHYMLSKASVKARPSVLWCYKKELALSRCAWCVTVCVCRGGGKGGALTALLSGAGGCAALTASCRAHTHAHNTHISTDATHCHAQPQEEAHEAAAQDGAAGAAGPGD